MPDPIASMIAWCSGFCDGVIDSEKLALADIQQVPLDDLPLISSKRSGLTVLGNIKPVRL